MMIRKLQGTLLALTVVAFGQVAHAQDRVDAGGGVRTISRFPLSGDDRARLSGAEEPRVSGSIRASLAAALPRSASVRNRMSPVRDQGARETCSVFAAIALLEANTNLDLSEQCLALQSRFEDPGHVSERLSFAAARGLYTEAECPYTNNRADVPPLGRPSMSTAGGGIMLQDTSLQSLQTLKELVAGGRPVAISVWVSTRAFFDNANSVIDVPPADQNLCRGTSTCGGHAVVVVGYDDATQQLTFKNSWGTGWKDGGYGRMTYRYFLESFMSGNANRMVAY